MASIQKPPSNLASIAGPMFIGCILNWGLFGVLTIQVYLFYIEFPREKWSTKAVVYLLFVFETVQLVIVTRDSFNAYCRSFGNMHVLESMRLEWFAVPVLCGITSCIVQIYYAYRLRVLSGSKLLAGVIVVISLVQGVAAVITGARSCVLKSFPHLASDTTTTWGVTVWSSGSAICDVTIAFSMTIVLLRQSTGMTETRKIVTRIICLVVETGCLTALAAVVFLIVFLSTRRNIYFVTCATSLAKLYSNALLTLLNARSRLNSQRTFASSVVLPMSFSNSTIISLGQSQIVSVFSRDTKLSVTRSI